MKSRLLIWTRRGPCMCDQSVRFVPTALAIADLIHERHYNTVVQNNDTDGSGFRGCLSACTAIWLSGWHVMVQNSAILGFHSCYNRDEDGHTKDNLSCDAEIADHLQKYGYTAHQAWALANASPNEIMRLGTKAWAASLGFVWQTLPSRPWYGGAGDYCQAKFCLMWP